MTPIDEALQRLQQGNQRFARRLREEGHADLRLGFAEMIAEQRPFAIVLGCSDSRAPVEIIFDQGPGSLFVIRVAGNIVAPSLIGSIEFAATKFGTGLVVVLGHTRCGAIAESLAVLQGATGVASDNLGNIVERIKPVITLLLERNPDRDEATLARAATRANVRQSMQQIEEGSPILQKLIEEGQLAIVGAEYALETGTVEFFDDAAQTHAPPEKQGSE